MRAAMALVRAMSMALAVSLPAPCVHAQSARVSGIVVDAPSARPVVGAVVQALDANGGVLARTLSRADGRFTLVADARSLRVMRIGFQPLVVVVPADGRDAVHVRLVPLPTLVSQVQVRANSRCPVRRDAAVVQGIYDQAKAALLASVVSRDAAPSTQHLIRFLRFPDARGEGIVTQDVTMDTLDSRTRSFESVRSAAAFVDSGYARGPDSLRTFLAPDADVLADEDFRLHYCLDRAPRDARRPTLAGLRFSRATASRRVDIEGGVWIDTVAWRLDRIEFAYTGVSEAERRFRPGGSITFRAMDNGAVLVDEFSLRVTATRTIEGVEPNRMGRAYAYTDVQVRESGGALARVLWKDGGEWRAPLGTLVVDGYYEEPSVTGPPTRKPAPARMLSLDWTTYRGRTDRSGELTLTDLLPGPYELIAHDSVMAEVGLILPTTVQFIAARDSVHRVSLKVPTVAEFAESLCGPQSRRRASAGSAGTTLGGTNPSKDIDNFTVIFFQALRSDGSPARGLEVTERRLLPGDGIMFDPQARRGKTDENGRYVSCWNYPIDSAVQFWVEQRGQQPQGIASTLTQRFNAIQMVVR